jgi:glycine C-acetyltransferase
MPFDFIERDLKDLKERDLYRTLTPIDGPQGPRVRVAGREVINLSSNNYLGIANHPKVIEAGIKALESYGGGSGASRLVSGTMRPHLELEEKLASFKGAEAALVFNSGYHANLSIITALTEREDIIFSDRLNHASIVDACILSRAKFKRYPHCDVDSLERMLKDSKGYRRRLIVTDGVFSMDGDIAPLKDISRLAEKYGATLMVDDAHATGVLGNHGRGTLEHLAINNSDIIQMGTLGKAVGSFGAFVAGRKVLIDYLINMARPFIYTTALPPSVCAASIAALDIIMEEPNLRDALWKRAGFFRGYLNNAGLDTMLSETQIMPVVIGNARKTLTVSNELLEEGIFVQAIRPPTVPEGTSRLRVTVMANHDPDDLKYAAETIKKVVLNNS